MRRPNTARPRRAGPGSRRFAGWGAALAGLALLAGCAGGIDPPRVEPFVAASPVVGRPGPTAADSLRPAPVPPALALAAPAGADTAGSVSPPSPGPGASAPDSSHVVAQGGEWTLSGRSLTSLAGGDVIVIAEPVIMQRDAVIIAHEGRYHRRDNRVELTGNVSYSDPDIQVRGQRAEYFEKTRILNVQEDVQVEGDSLTLSGARGTYDRDAETLRLEGGITGQHGNRRFRAQTADWRRRTDRVDLRQNVRVEDDVERATLSGEQVFYDLKTGRARVPETPQLLLPQDDGPDMRILGRRMDLEESGTVHVSGGVTVIRGGIEAHSDSASFFRHERHAVFLGSPRVTERDGTLTGDTLYFYFDERDALTRADVHGNAFVRYVPTDSLHLGEESTVKGDSLSMFFGQETAERVETWGRASSTYRPTSLDILRGSGTNAAQGDTITIFLEAGKVDRAVLTGEAHGVYVWGGEEPDSVVADSAAADTAADDRERVVYAGRRIEYDMDEHIVDLYTEARVEYRELVLDAGKIRLFVERRYLEAEDNPVLVEAAADRRVVGQRMDYNVQTREGTIDGGRTEAEDGTIEARRLRQVSEDQFIARGGRYTTCDLLKDGKEPHYHFRSEKMRIYMKDKVIARPVTLYIRNIPVLAIPFYVFSIRKGRHSGLLTPDFNFGLVGSSGPFFRNLGYYWAASDFYDFFFRADYTQNPSRFVGRIDARYARRYLMQGELNVARVLGSGQSGYDVSGAHNMSLGDWKITGRAEFRNQEFRRSEPLGTDFGARLDRQLLSDLAVSRSFPIGASFTLKAERREDLGARPGDGHDDVILSETLPNYSFSLNSRPLGRAPDAEGKGGRLPFLANLRFSFASSGSSALTERERTTVTPADTAIGALPDTSYRVERARASQARHTLSISDRRRLLDALNLSVGVNLAESWVDREFTPTDTLHAFRRAAVWSTSLGFGTSAFGTFGGLGPVQSFRHTVEPSMSLNYQPEFTGLTYVDTSGARHNRYPGVFATENKSMALTLNQRFQAKVKVGDIVRRVDLLSWRLGSGYDFLAEKRGLRGWEDVRSEVDVSRIYGVSLRFNSTHDPYRQGRFKNFQLTGSFSLRGKLPGGESAPADLSNALGEGADAVDWAESGADLSGRGRQDVGSTRGGQQAGWNLGCTVSYNGNRDPAGAVQTTAALNLVSSLQISKNWSIQYQNRWDVTKGEILGEGLTLHRDLHCWEAEFTRSRLGGETSFYFRINVKQMPDVKYEQGVGGATGFDDLTRLLP